MKPWDELMTAAQALEDEAKTDRNQALAWFLRREAGLSAFRFVDLTTKGLPEAHALTLALDDAAYFVAASAAREVAGHGQEEAG